MISYPSLPKISLSEKQSTHIIFKMISANDLTGIEALIEPLIPEEREKVFSQHFKPAIGESKNPVEFCASEENVAILDYLVSKGAKIDTNLFRIAAESPKTFANLLIRYRHHPEISNLSMRSLFDTITSLPTAEIIVLASGDSPQLFTELATQYELKINKYYLFQAASLGYLDLVIHILKDTDIDITSSDRKGRNVLYFALESCSPPLVDYLMENYSDQLDLNKKNPEGESRGVANLFEYRLDYTFPLMAVLNLYLDRPKYLGMSSKRKKLPVDSTKIKMMIDHLASHYAIDLFPFPYEDDDGENGEWLKETDIMELFNCFGEIEENKPIQMLKETLERFRKEHDSSLRKMSTWRCKGETLLEHCLRVAKYDLATHLLIMGISAEVFPLRGNDLYFKEIETKLSFILMRKNYLEKEVLDAGDWIRLGSDEALLAIVHQESRTDIIASQILGEACMNLYTKFTKERKCVPNWDNNKKEAAVLSAEESAVTRRETICLFEASSQQYPKNIRLIEAQMEAFSQISGGVSGEVCGSRNALDAAFKAIDVLNQKRKKSDERRDKMVATLEKQLMAKQDRRAPLLTQINLPITTSFSGPIPATTSVSITKEHPLKRFKWK